MTDEIVIDTKQLHVGYLHGLANSGGSFVFPNFPFGINIVGDGSAYVKVQLFTVPQGQMIKGHSNPKIPKKAKPKKPEPVENIIEEGETIEM